MRKQAMERKSKKRRGKESLRRKVREKTTMTKYEKNKDEDDYLKKV